MLAIMVLSRSLLPDADGLLLCVDGFLDLCGMPMDLDVELVLIDDFVSIDMDDGGGGGGGGIAGAAVGGKGGGKPSFVEIGMKCDMNEW